MENMVYSLLWVMQDFVHQPYEACPSFADYVPHEWGLLGVGSTSRSREVSVAGA